MMWASQMALVVKDPPASAGDEMWVQPLGQEDPLEEALAIQPRLLAWRIPCTEEPGGPQSIGSRSVTEATSHTRVYNGVTLLYNAN